MKIRVIQWNIKINSDARKIADLLRKKISGMTIMHLQEVSAKSNEKIVSMLKPDGYDYSLNHRTPGRYEGRNRTMGVTTMTFGGEIKEGSLIHRSVFPERTLESVTDFNGKKIRSLNFHSLTGVDYKKAKSSNFASIADHLTNKDFDFFACDANEPKSDSLYTERIEFFDNRDQGRCAELIFGSPPVHALRDALKTKLIKQNNHNLESPLAVSHRTGGNLRRYDHIYHSEKWSVIDVLYDYESAIESSSDHAIVIADFGELH